MIPHRDPWVALLTDPADGADDVVVAVPPRSNGSDRDRSPVVAPMIPGHKGREPDDADGGVSLTDDCGDIVAGGCGLDDPFAMIDDGDTGEIPLDGGRAAGGRAQVIVVIGATGGAGATTVACGLAVVMAQGQSGVTLLDVDFESGDTHDGFDVPRGRSIGDLVPVLAELRATHLDLIGLRHDCGVELMFAPATRGAADEWRAADVQCLLGCAAARGPVIVDAGRARADHLEAACTLADHVVVVAPATLRGARRVRDILRRHPSNAQVTLNHALPAEIGSRAFATACGAPIWGELPRARRAADQLRAGHLPMTSRGFRRALTTLATGVAHGTR